MNQINYDDANLQDASIIQDRRPEMVAPNEPHMACVLVLDRSGSMSGGAIKQLNKGVNAFQSEVLQDPKTRDILEICTVGFDDAALLVQDWVPIESMSPSNLSPGGGTNFEPALRMAIDKVNERVTLYKNTIGPNFFKPWIVMITDGRNGSTVDKIAAELRGLDEMGKLRLWALGVDNFDESQLKQLTDRVLKLRDHDFTTFFNWLTKSMRAVSVTAPGATPQLPNLPNNVNKVA